MAILRMGQKLRTRVAHAAMKRGGTGTVTSVHHGLFYGVATDDDRGVAYVPGFHADADDGMVNPADSPGGGGAGSGTGSSGSTSGTGGGGSAGGAAGGGGGAGGSSSGSGAAGT